MVAPEIRSELDTELALEDNFRARYKRLYAVSARFFDLLHDGADQSLFLNGRF